MIVLEATGVGPTQEALANWGVAVQNAALAFAAMAADFQDEERRRFDAEGPGWAPLAPSTLATKAQRGQPETILEATGRLRASLTGESVFGNDDMVFRPEPEGFFIGTRTPYAKYHQFGTPQMPQREIVTADEALTARWAVILLRYFVAEATGVRISGVAV